MNFLMLWRQRTQFAGANPTRLPHTRSNQHFSGIHSCRSRDAFAGVAALFYHLRTAVQCQKLCKSLEAWWSALCPPCTPGLSSRATGCLPAPIAVWFCVLPFVLRHLPFSFVLICVFSFVSTRTITIASQFATLCFQPLRRHHRPPLPCTPGCFRAASHSRSVPKLHPRHRRRAPQRHAAPICFSRARRSVRH